MPKYNMKIKSTCLLALSNCMLKQLDEIEWDGLILIETKMSEEIQHALSMHIQMVSCIYAMYVA